MNNSTREYLPYIIAVIIGFCCICGIFAIAVINTKLINPAKLAPVQPLNTSIPIEVMIAQTSSVAQTQTMQAMPSPTAPPLPTSTLASTALAACIPNTQPQNATVVDVVDGDTIKVMLDDGLIYPVRYIGMDTPEDTSQTEFYGAQASAKNMELVYGKTVTMYRDVSEVDGYGRLLRYVFVGDIFVNYELVAQGFAEAKEYPPDTACASYYSNAQQIASASRMGVWSIEATPIIISTSTSDNSGNNTNAVCSCSSNSYDCGNFSTHSAAQACFDYCRSLGKADIHKLDKDKDGSACEDLP
jgi:micrococcal nuclease